MEEENARLLRQRVRRADARGARPRLVLVWFFAAVVCVACLVTVSLESTRTHATLENSSAPWRPYRYRVGYLPQAAGAVAALLSAVSSHPQIGDAAWLGAHVAAHLAACLRATWFALFLTLALAYHAIALPRALPASEKRLPSRLLVALASAAVWAPLAWDVRNDVDYLVAILLAAAFLASTLEGAVSCALVALVAPWHGVGV